jgi:uncharacterized membrane protein (DUF4010 family)
MTDVPTLDVSVFPTLFTAQAMLLLLGLSFLLGLAIEDVYSRLGRDRPGGVRTFPVLAMAGAVLYGLEPRHALGFIAGLVVIGAWLFAYYRVQVETAARSEAEEARDTEHTRRGGLGIMVPATNLVAYLLGPVVLLTPTWFSIGVTVTTVLLLGARDALHDLARRIPMAEITTLGKFLILTGIVLPLLPNEPVVTWTQITPHQAWLAVVAVATLSYASYLAQRLAPATLGVLFASALGGLYSSTATTVVLARHLREAKGRCVEVESGIVLATALMYLRILIVIGIFDRSLAMEAAPWLAGLALLSLGLAAAVFLSGRARSTRATSELPPPGNPLELSAALVFALLFVAVSLGSVWVQQHYGSAGVYVLAAVVGVTDIDPFVLSLAQGGLDDAPGHVLITAILVAASSNGVLKAVYAGGFGGIERSTRAVLALVVAAAAGFVTAALVAGTGPG